MIKQPNVQTSCPFSTQTHKIAQLQLLTQVWADLLLIIVMKSLVINHLRADLDFSLMRMMRIWEILWLVNLTAKYSIASIDKRNHVNKILMIKLLQNFYLATFLKQKRMNKNHLFSHSLSNNSQKLTWFTHASHPALISNSLTWKLMEWRSMNSTNSQCTALIRFQHLTQTVANMLLTLSSLMVDGNVQNAKTTISRVANHAIVVKNQNLMKTMMASQNICSKQLKRKRSLKYKRIKQKN